MGLQSKNQSALCSLWETSRPRVLGMLFCKRAAGRLWAIIFAPAGEVWQGWLVQWCTGLPLAWEKNDLLIHIETWLSLTSRLVYMGTLSNRADNGKLAVGETSVSFKPWMQKTCVLFESCWQWRENFFPFLFLFDLWDICAVPGPQRWLHMEPWKKSLFRKKR